MIFKDDHFLNVTISRNDARQDISKLSSSRFHRWLTGLS